MAKREFPCYQSAYLVPSSAVASNPLFTSQMSAWIDDTAPCCAAKCIERQNREMEKVRLSRNRSSRTGYEAIQIPQTHILGKAVYLGHQKAIDNAHSGA